MQVTYNYNHDRTLSNDEIYNHGQEALPGYNYGQETIGSIDNDLRNEIIQIIRQEIMNTNLHK